MCDRERKEIERGMERDCPSNDRYYHDTGNAIMKTINDVTSSCNFLILNPSFAIWSVFYNVKLKQFIIFGIFLYILLRQEVKFLPFKEICAKHNIIDSYIFVIL